MFDYFWRFQNKKRTTKVVLINQLDFSIEGTSRTSKLGHNFCKRALICGRIFLGHCFNTSSFGRFANTVISINIVITWKKIPRIVKIVSKIAHVDIPFLRTKLNYHLFRYSIIILLYRQKYKRNYRLNIVSWIIYIIIVHFGLR